MTQKTIKVNGEFWTGNLSGWTLIPESAISYGIWTRQPSAERREAMRAELRAAIDADFAAFEAAGNEFDPMSIFDMPTPRQHAVIARLGDEYEAMLAYQSFYECSVESAGQVWEGK